MASQGERESGVVDMDEGVLESMAQDGDPEQEMLVVQDELPQLNPEPEMDAAHGAPPSPLRQSPSPAPSETATDRGDSASSEAAEFCRLGEMLMGMMQQMMDKMDANMQAFRSETRAVELKMATPRAGTDKLRESANCVGPAMEAGEDKIIQEMCWGRLVKVTERVTVTETCTRHVETREITSEVTELGTVGERLHGTDGVEEDAHTHTHTGSGGQWGRARTTCWNPVRAAG